MATLSVLKFNDPYGADRARDALEGMHARQIITLEDEAVVSWPLGEQKPVFPKDNLEGDTALGGAFWGFLLGLIFAVPLLSAAIGAGASAALSSSLEGGGIDADFI
jgi:uncharacterized membrane protein